MSTLPVDAITFAIDDLYLKHGSLRAAARVLGVDAGYLSRLHRGEKRNPSDKLLRKLRVEKIVTYRGRP